MPNEIIHTGINPSERYLSALCRRSFLKLWTYSGVSRDQATGHGNPLGKEICDLLAIFENDIIIFSDKYCEYPNGGDPKLAWARWYSAISNSAKQLAGAERWLREHPDRVYTDVSCQELLPIKLPTPDKARYHRILVAHGASKACVAHFGGGRGSLVLDNRADGSVLFHVGPVQSVDGFVHIFDDFTLDVVLRSLNTISDFTAYLRKKELLLNGTREIVAEGEEELLARYLMSMNEKEEHDFDVPEGTSTLLFSEGHWRRFTSSPERREQLTADKVSYAWDRLIETFVRHTLQGTHRNTTQSSVAEQEVVYRWLARENRIRRRMLARSLLGIIIKTPPKTRAVRVVEPSYAGDPFFVFLVVPTTSSYTQDEYRDMRQWLLQQHLLVLKLLYPQVQAAVGIATEAGRNITYRSEDLLFYDYADWSPQLEDQAREVQRELRIFTRTIRSASRENEYPKNQQPLRGPLKWTGTGVSKSATMESRKPLARNELVAAVRRSRK